MGRFAMRNTRRRPPVSQADPMTPPSCKNPGCVQQTSPVTLSAYAPINFRVPGPFAQGGSMVPPATNFSSYQYYYERRICAFGSLHPGRGANFAMGDASVRFVLDSLPLAMLQRLCVRYDGEPAATE